MPPVYHRLHNTRTQSDATAREQQRSGRICGREALWSHLKSVKAYPGLLPRGRAGIEFETPLPPTDRASYVSWLEGAPGVVASADGDYVCIEVTIRRIVPDAGEQRRASRRAGPPKEAS